MTEYKLSEIYVYPVKSLGGVSLNQAEVTDRGLQHDRLRMLIDNENNFISQRKIPEMALLQTELSGEHIRVFHKQVPSLEIKIPLGISVNAEKHFTEVYMWDEAIFTAEYNPVINEWFSDVLKTKCRLVYMPPESRRMVDVRYALNKEITSLSDGYPFLLIGQESLNLLNSKLENPVPVNRFRPNFVFTGGQPHDEDKWINFSIGKVAFKIVKPCARCIITTTDQNTGQRGQEPLKTLSTYRTINNKVMFGQNLLHEGTGKVATGDSIIILPN